ncbi:HD domain-containing protein [Proteiniclasticum ruminis]|uniref:HD superfamily phosphodieaserase, includes HD domain of RNase Y n=1 Tax=Proteiniclasticum ruminis TaxID=398199 RepID=A0A1G8QYN3_9CLOT|nr:HD domain-containing protein [Proteiniclasticum ruminis]SDJ09771.1 HD superfamily phosphodieaserase, includes HD domain of RNase Y [Proteiniclasticum ruminis]
MKQVIHIYGASGSGTSTLGREISKRLGYVFLDTDDFFWKRTNPMYSEKMSPEEAVTMIFEKIRMLDQVVLCGSLVDWGDELIKEFTLAVRLDTETKVRLHRIKEREYEKFGARILPEGDMYEQHLRFLEWAGKYDTGSAHMRSREKHDQWQKLLPCPQLNLSGEDPLEKNVEKIEDFLAFMEKTEVIKKLVESHFLGEASGHDVYHTLRVYRNALMLAKETDCSLEVVSLAALLHDVDDEKLFQSKEHQFAKKFLGEAGISLDLQKRVLEAISTVSFKNRREKTPSTIEGMVVQDADRLDALGAIGIARTFAFGGSRGRAMYDPTEKPNLEMTPEEYRNSQGTSVNHFYEKLFLLKDLMNTETAKEMAREREEFMRRFLEQFYQEWNGF